MDQQSTLPTVFDPSTNRFITVAEAQQIMAAGQQRSSGPALPPGSSVGPGGGSLGVSSGQPGQFAGVTLPPGSPELGSQIGQAIPQVAGLAASFVPQLRGAKAAMGIPAAVEAIMQQIKGEDFNLDPVVMNALEGLFAHGVGQTLEGVGHAGTSLVKKSLNLGSTPYATRAGEAMLPRLALKEKAEMTIPGVDRIAAKAKATGAGGLEDLAAALEQARLGNSLAPVGGGGGIMSAVRDLFSAPRQMAAGQAMAAPFGLDTAKQIAPAAEAAVRSFMAWLASQTGGAPAASAASETRRRMP